MAMLIMGVVGEILIKLILLKENYVINEIKTIKIINLKPKFFDIFNQKRIFR